MAGRYARFNFQLGVFPCILQNIFVVCVEKTALSMTELGLPLTCQLLKRLHELLSDLGLLEVEYFDLVKRRRRRLYSLQGSLLFTAPLALLLTTK